MSTSAILPISSPDFGATSATASQQTVFNNLLNQLQQAVGSGDWTTTATVLNAVNSLSPSSASSSTPLGTFLTNLGTALNDGSVAEAQSAPSPHIRAPHLLQRPPQQQPRRRPVHSRPLRRLKASSFKAKIRHCSVPHFRGSPATLKARRAVLPTPSTAFTACSMKPTVRAVPRQAHLRPVGPALPPAQSRPALPLPMTRSSLPSRPAWPGPTEH